MAAPLLAGARSALIISNAEYRHAGKLKNPPNDVLLISEKLKGLGFSVRMEFDVDARRFSEVLHEFSASLDRDTDALFYYAGHGMQYRGENLLIGIDAELRNEASLQFETYQLNTVLQLLEQKAGTVLLFWDACRNNPLAARFIRSLGAEPARTATALVRAGAAPIPPSSGDTLVVYSAEPGKVALDGSGSYSPFAESLAKHLPTPDVEIEAMLKRVTFDVLNTTQRAQRPERLSQLTREFYFNRGDRAEVAAYEEELSELRARLAMIEQPQRKSRLRIIGTDKPVKPKRAKIAKIASRDAAVLSRDVAGAPAETGSVSAEEQEDADLSGILVSVNTATAAMVRRLKFSPQGDLLAMGDDDGVVRLMRLDDFAVTTTIAAHAQRVSDLDFSADGKTLLTAGRDGVVRYWDVASGRKIREIKIDKSIVYSARINPAAPERWVLMGDRGGRLHVWDLKRGRSITNFRFHKGPVLAVAYAPDRTGTLVSAGGDGVLRIRLHHGQRYAIRAHERPVFQAGFSASGRYIYSASADREIKLWAPHAGSTEPEKTFKGHMRYVLTADMSPDDALIVSGGGDKVLNLWDVRSGALVGQFKGHTSDVESVVFSPDGKLVVSASEDKTVRIWALEDRHELARLMFEKGGDAFVGVTADNELFGDPDTDLLSIYVDGRHVDVSDAREAAPYLGRSVRIVGE